MTKYPILNINAAETNAGKVLIIYTGGTLGMVFDHKIGSLVPFKFEQILNDLPELKRLGLNLSFLALPEPIDSSNVSPEVWTELTNIIENYYNEYQGFVILHGTDTMAYTAGFEFYDPKPHEICRDYGCTIANRNTQNRCS